MVFVLFAASLLLALFIITKLFGGRSLNSIRANTVGHGQHGSARWATKREVRRYYTMVPYEPQKWRGDPNRGRISRVSSSAHGSMVGNEFAFPREAVRRRVTTCRIVPRAALCLPI